MRGVRDRCAWSFVDHGGAPKADAGATGRGKDRGCGHHSRAPRQAPCLCNIPRERSTCVWKNSPVKASGPELLFVGRFGFAFIKLQILPHF